MIVPMKKVTLLVLETEREKALLDLRKLGLVHVETKPAESKNLTELNTLQNKIIQAKNLLTDVLGKVAKNIKNKPVGLSGSEKKRVEMIDEILALNERKKEIATEIASISAIMREYSGFDNFNPADFEFLQEKGVTLAIASAVDKQYEALFVEGVQKKNIEKSELKVLKLGEDKKKIIFLIVAGEEGLPATIDSAITILPLPEKSNSEYAEDIKALRNEAREANNKLRSFSKNISELEAFEKINAKRIEFETVYAGMETVALKNTVESENATELSCLVGYIPTKGADKLKRLATEKAWGLVVEDPTEKDAVPTKLENNTAVSTIYPLYDFLNMFPGYFEFDVSWAVLLFFGIFTAMVFGDAGYGSIILLGCIFSIIKTKMSGKKIGAGLRLFTYLGVLTVIWGTLSCSWFGMDTSLVPEFLKKPSIPGLVDESTKNSNIMFVSFTMGFLHLMLAHIIAIVRGKKNLSVFGHVGAMGMILGMYFLILNILVSAERFPMQNWVPISIGVGFALDFVFGNYETTVGASILASLKDFVGKFLGLVNVFADIMSYVRLWAVGLAGASISLAVNSIGGPMLGKFVLFIFGLIICVSGHGLNMVLNVLSVIVHAVRLNTMEFSGHVGLEWSGFKYKPFVETVE